jgi:aminoglycoside N3'-acetyltransferase
MPNKYVRNLLGTKKKFERLLIPVRSRGYTSYQSEEFIESLGQIGILPGDNLFIMHSQDKIYINSGRVISPSVVLKDLLCYLGRDSTIMMLCFSPKREQIISGEEVFDVRKTATDSGMLSEMLRRKKGSHRSLHPIFSAVAYGPSAQELCSYHHLSPYPFDETSPYYKLMKSGAKYLGLGVGFEAFTPCHMIEDYYKSSFKHRIYLEKTQEFSFVNQDGERQYGNFFVRDLENFPVDYDPHRYFSMTNVMSRKIVTSSGIRLCSFKIEDFFLSAIELYDKTKVTVWDTPSLAFRARRKVKGFIKSLQ